jgi:deoxyribodipyrimidine photo-lyase
MVNQVTSDQQNLLCDHVVFWFRRDLRLDDNVGLYQALKNSIDVVPIFIFDTTILESLENKCDARVCFIYNTLQSLQKELLRKGSSLIVLIGNPIDIFRQIAPKVVYANHDYEPSAINRDDSVNDILTAKNAALITFKDQVIFEKSELVKSDGTPYVMFTPYASRWKAALALNPIQTYPSEKLTKNFIKISPQKIPSLDAIGFIPSDINIPSKKISEQRIRDYHKTRDIPSINGTSRLSVHLRFGTISIRKIIEKAMLMNEVWLNELIWREFYMMILYHFPYVVHRAFKSQYEAIAWENNEQDFQRWCEGKTGFPLVDAGMRELNATGFMHNRVRMVTASFLTKHLLIDWRWGEAYFAQKLLDYEASSNNGGWQWAASTGCDAVPYFRIFNPATQHKKFDPQSVYVNRWIPEWNTPAYPSPMIDHAFARERALNRYRIALQKHYQE